MTISKTTKINIVLSIFYLLICDFLLIMTKLFYGFQIQTHSNIWFGTLIIITTIIIGSFILYFISFLLSNTLILILTKNKLDSFTYKLISFVIIFIIIFILAFHTSATEFGFTPIFLITIIAMLKALILTLIYSNNKNSRPLFFSVMYSSIITILSIALIPFIYSII